MSPFTREGGQLLRQEAARRREEGTLEEYQTPLESASELFRRQARALHKEQLSLDTNLQLLEEEWRKVRESRTDDELDANVAEYLKTGKRLAEWLKLMEPDEQEDLSAFPSMSERFEGPARQVEALKRIDPSDPDKWSKLLKGLRKLGGVQGSQKFYEPDEIIRIVEDVRRGRQDINRVTSGGDLGLHEIVASFMKADAQPAAESVRADRAQESAPRVAPDESAERGAELQGFRVGDRVLHPFTGKEVVVTAVGTRVADFEPRAQSGRSGRVRGVGYHVLVGSPEFSVLRQNRNFVLAGEREVKPSAEIESPTAIERRTMVVPLTSLKHAA